MYASLEQLKARLGLENSDSKDEELERCLVVASKHIDSKCHRTFQVPTGMPETRTYYAAGTTIFVDDIASDAIVTNYGDDEIDATPIRGAYNWPYTRLILATRNSGYRNEVSVTAMFGWPETPPEVEEATLLLAHRLFKRADTPAGVGGFDQTGAVVRVSYRDPDVEALLGPYKKAVLA